MYGFRERNDRWVDPTKSFCRGHEKKEAGRLVWRCAWKNFNTDLQITERSRILLFCVTKLQGVLIRVYGAREKASFRTSMTVQGFRTGEHTLKPSEDTVLWFTGRRNQHADFSSGWQSEHFVRVDTISSRESSPKRVHGSTGLDLSPRRRRKTGLAPSHTVTRHPVQMGLS